MSNLQPGDLLFYDNGSGIGHVSMYIGNGQVVHASNEQTGIIVSSVDYRTACAARSYF
jgi:cell wall-associated NlpC family hydrolase